MQNGLSTSVLTVLREDRVILRAVTLHAGPGEALVLRGANGAGKTTLLRTLAGLRRPDAGRVAWDGGDIADDPAAHAARTALLGHLDAVKPGLTARENLGLAAGLSGGDPDAALDAMGLRALADLPARALSAGQKRRLALARVILLARPLWLLDEPLLGLDAASRARLGDAMTAHRAAGGTIVAATHDPLPLDGARDLAL